MGASHGARRGQGARRGLLTLGSVLLAAGLAAGLPPQSQAADPTLETYLQTLWGQMLDALALEDIEGALVFVEPAARDRYRENFRILGPRLHEEAAALRRMRLLRVEGGRAICEIQRTGSGRSYPLHFRRDPAGGWWIEEM